MQTNQVENAVFKYIEKMLEEVEYFWRNFGNTLRMNWLWVKKMMNLLWVKNKYSDQNVFSPIF